MLIGSAFVAAHHFLENISHRQAKRALTLDISVTYIPTVTDTYMLFISFLYTRSKILY